MILEQMAENYNPLSTHNKIQKPTLVGEGLHVLNVQIEEAIRKQDRPSLITRAGKEIAAGAEALAINLNEGCRILEEKIVNGYKIIDDANNAGMNVPGPFITSKKRYLEYCELLENLVDQTGIEYFKPCDLMKSGKFLQMRK